MYNLGDKVIYTNNKSLELVNFEVWRGTIIDNTLRCTNGRYYTGSHGKIIYKIQENGCKDNGRVRSVSEKFVVGLDKEWYREQKLNSILNE